MAILISGVSNVSSSDSLTVVMFSAINPATAVSTSVREVPLTVYASSSDALYTYCVKVTSPVSLLLHT